MKNYDKTKVIFKRPLFAGTFLLKNSFGTYQLRPIYRGVRYNCPL